MPRTAQPHPGDEAAGLIFSGAIYRTTGHRFLLATVLFLFFIGFIAFPTRAFAEHLADPAARVTGAQFYTLALTATGAAWYLKWRTGRRAGDVDDRLNPAYVERLDRSYLWTMLLLAAAAPLAFVRWEVGLALAGAVTLYHLRPPETPVYKEQAPAVEEGS